MLIKVLWLHTIAFLLLVSAGSFLNQIARHFMACMLLLTYCNLFLIDSQNVLIHRTHDDPTTTSVPMSGVSASLWY